MSNKVEVKLDFINKRGEEKKVKFYMDKTSYEILSDSSINEMYRHQYLINEYHEYEREKYYKRKYSLLDIEILDQLKNTKDFENDNYDYLYSAIEKLNDKQKELIKLIFFEGYSQTEVAKMQGVSKQAINNSLNKIYSILRKQIKK